MLPGPGAVTRSRGPARRPPEPRPWGESFGCAPATPRSPSLSPGPGGSRSGDVTWARIAPGGIARIECRRISSRRARTARGGVDCVALGSHCASRFRRAPAGRDGSGHRPGWAGAGWCGWGSWDDPGRDVSKSVAKAPRDRIGREKNRRISTILLRRSGSIRAFATDLDNRPSGRLNERPELRPRWGAWDSWGVRGAPARRGSGGRCPWPPTTAPGPRGRPGRPRKGLVAQGPDRTLIGVTPPGTVLLPYSDDGKVRSHDTAVSGLPRRPVPRPRLRPQDQELP